VRIDLINDALPAAGILLCRDCFVHFCNADVAAAIRTIKKSEIEYLLTTTFEMQKNIDILTGQWRPLNFREEPFYFPKPLLIINEECTEEHGRFTDKVLALWRVDSLPEST